jgi:HAMP domain-containing protein
LLCLSFPSQATHKSIAAFKTKLETGRRRAEVAEARLAEVERLADEKGRKVQEMEERLRLTREVNTTLKYLVPVLQKLSDAELKFVTSLQLPVLRTRLEYSEY